MVIAVGLIGVGAFIITAFSFPDQQFFGNAECRPVTDCANCTEGFDKFECSAENFVQVMKLASSLDSRIILAPIPSIGGFLLLLLIPGIVGISKKSRACSCIFSVLHIIWLFVVLGIFTLVTAIYLAQHDTVISEGLEQLLSMLDGYGTYSEAINILVRDILIPLAPYTFIVGCILLVLVISSMTCFCMYSAGLKSSRQIHAV